MADTYIIESAKTLLLELYKERIDYDEYTTLMDAISELENENKDLNTRLNVIEEAVNGKNRSRK